MRRTFIAAHLARERHTPGNRVGVAEDRLQLFDAGILHGNLGGDWTFRREGALLEPNLSIEIHVRRALLQDSVMSSHRLRRSLYVRSKMIPAQMIHRGIADTPRGNLEIGKLHFARQVWLTKTAAEPSSEAAMAREIERNLRGAAETGEQRLPFGKIRRIYHNMQVR